VIELLTAGGNAPFSIALLVMFGLLIFELVSLVSGLGVNEILDDIVTGNVDFPELPDSSIGGGGEVPSGIEGSGAPEGGSLLGRILAWLYVGQVPLLVVLVVFLAIFGIFGLVAQTLLRQLTGFALPALVAAPAVFFMSIPVVRWTTGGLSRILPREETSAVSVRDFIGRTATIVGGDARAELPSQAKLQDQFGTTHYVLVAPEEEEAVLSNGSLVLLVRKVGGRFTAIPNPNAALADDQ
jgi:hypothetical protein